MSADNLFRDPACFVGFFARRGERIVVGGKEKRYEARS